MSLLYFAVANEKVIVCHYPPTSSNFEKVVKEYLCRAPPDQDFCFSQSGFSFHCITTGGLSFVAVTNTQCFRQHARSFIISTSCNFCSDPARMQQARLGPEGCLQDSYGLVLKQLMGDFDKYKVNSQLEVLRNNVDSITAVMQKNAVDVLQRGEHLDNLVTKTDELESSAGRFQTATTKVARKAKCENLKMKFIIIGIVGGVLLIILILILWQTGLLSSHK